MKRKLLLAALVVVGCLEIQAQKDVTSQYITNATLSNGTTGWTVTNKNDGPAQGNNTTGYAMEFYAGWNALNVTSYSALQTITLPAGNYTLVNYSFFRQGQNYNTDSNKSLAKLKAGDNEVSLKTLGSITAAGYANSMAEGANVFDSKMYRNTVDFTIDADNTEIEIGVYGTFDEAKSWCILGMFELIDNGTAATMDAPFDVTGYITNPGFEYRDMTGWTLSGESVIGTQNNSQSFKVGGYYAQTWQPSTSGALAEGSMSQTLTSLPAGYYKLTANLGGNGTYVDLNGKTANWTEDKDYTVGYVLSENEDLTITAGKTAEGTANWIHFDNFKLYFCGDVAAALTTLLGQVDDYDGTIPSAAYSALQADVAAYDQSYSDVDELLAAIADVQELYEAADALVAPYTAWLAAKATADGYNVEGINSVVSTQSTTVEAATDAATINTATTTVAALNTAYASFSALKAKADILVAVNNDNSSANSTLSTAISDQNTAATAATTADAINTATSTLKAAMTTYVGAANPEGNGAQFDCTFLMTNPDLSGFTSWTKVENVDGWYTDQTTEGQNAQVMKNDGVACSKGNAFFEYWSATAAANGEFTLYNKVNLPEGTFAINCYALATANGVAGATTSAIYFYANDTEGSLISADKLTEAEITFVNNTQQDVKIGLKAKEGNQFRWMGIGYVELYKVPAQTYTVSENEEYDDTQSGAGDVTLNRTIKVGLNTLVLPFSMTQAEVEEKFGEGSVVYSVSSYENENISFASRSGISANEPCLLKATVAGTSYTLADRTITAANTDAPTVNGTNVSMIGTYAASADVEKNASNYVLSSGELYLVTTDGLAISCTRAYIQLADGGSAKSRVLTMSFDGEVTGIAAIEGDNISLETGVIYNLSGQRVVNPTKGIYIVNGKKVLVK